MERRMVIVRNPVSGRGRGAKSWPRAEALIDAHSERNRWRIEVFATSVPEDTYRLASKAADACADLVVVAGGDGTLMGVAEGILESSPPDPGNPPAIGVLPLGTGNDFCRTLGIGTDLELAVRTLFDGEPSPIDVGTWSCGGRRGYFLNVAGCGFDAAVAERINRGFRWIGGTPAYVAAVLQTLASYRASLVEVEVDGRRRQLRAMLCAVANGTCYGGGMRVAPHARLDDGRLDFVTVGDVSTLEFLRTFPKVFAGTHLEHPMVESELARSVRVESDPSLPVLADGEVVGSTPAEFGVLSGALLALRPIRKQTVLVDPSPAGRIPH